MGANPPWLEDLRAGGFYTEGVRVPAVDLGKPLGDRWDAAAHSRPP